MILSETDIKDLCQQDPPLIRGFVNWEWQLQPGGFDLTVARVFELTGPGTIHRVPGNNLKAQRDEVMPDTEGLFCLSEGYYVVACNEIVAMPTNILGLAHTRSTLLRYGSFLITGVWDPGFEGHSQFGLLVTNPQGIRIEKNSIIAQMTFHVMSSETEGFKYNHFYKKGLI